MSSAYKSWFPLVGRIFIGAVFVIFGFIKILNFSAMVDLLSILGIPFASLALVIAIILELGGAIFLILGFQTLWAALGLILFIILATVFFHLDLTDQAQQSLLLKNLALIGALLYVIAYGPGRFSLDKK